jgi:hypothetical protein
MIKMYRVLQQFTYCGYENAWGVGFEVAIDSDEIGNLVTLGYLEEIV